MTTEAILHRLQSWRERWTRTAWKPITSETDGDATTSKFGGTPWLDAGESWPICPHCQTAMPLFFQLNLAQLPAATAGIYGRGLLQLFYCTACDDAWEPFVETSLVRLVQSVGASPPPPPPPQTALPAKQITGWDAFNDLPNPQDHAQLGLEYDYDFGTPLRTIVSGPALDAAIEVCDVDDLAEQIGTAAIGDKLAGWPHWIQGAEYPSCPRCGCQMRHVLQLDSEDHLPFMFGDAGIGHLTQCPEHHEVVAFGWACS